MNKPARPPRTAEARAARDRGLPPVERRLPAPRLCATAFRVPDRLLRDAALSPIERLVAAAICAEGRRGEVAVGCGNARLARRLGLSVRRVQLALAALEAAGWVYRLAAWDGFARDSLDLVGYRDPWDADGRPRPPRAIVLLWRLPAIADDLRHQRVGPCASQRARPDTPERAEGQGVRP